MLYGSLNESSVQFIYNNSLYLTKFITNNKVALLIMILSDLGTVGSKC